MLVNVSDNDATVDGTVFRQVPSTGTVKVHSVNFKDGELVVG